MSTPRGASAPGKLMISGEYVVLDGAVAVVAAADARAQVWWPGAAETSGIQARGTATGALPPEVAATRVIAEAQLGVTASTSDDPLRLDVSALRRGDRKLGLGSSAAAAAATAGAVFARAGRSLEDADTRRALLEIALEGHRSVAPEGSGADVAASVLGGLVRFQRDPASGAVREAASIALPPGAHLRVVWTGREARTSELVRRVRALAATAPGLYARAMGALGEAAARMAEAFVQADARALLEAVAAHHAAMAALGEAAGAPIVEDGLRRAATLAGAHGGAAKPSGAGGGDVALAFFDDAAAADAFEQACAAHGLEPVDVALGAPGVRAEPAAPRG